MNIEEMRKKKKELGYTNAMIAEKTGLSIGAVQKYFSGETSSPRYDTIMKLSKLFRPDVDEVIERWKQNGSKLPDHVADSAGADRVNELAVDFYSVKSKEEKDASRGNRVMITHQIVLDEESRKKWPRQGEYTIDDYNALPDDVRVELIDGVIYDMTAPTVTHQTLALETALRFRECIKKHDMPCRAVIAPLDVRLDEDNKTVVQPDVVVYCGKDRAEDQKLWIPELTVEVLSPSTRKKDLTIKLEKYSQAGVREYWIVDPENEKVLVYDFASETYPKIYDFTDKVPVGLSGGICEIDFSEIKDELEESAELLPHLFG